MAENEPGHPKTEHPIIIICPHCGDATEQEVILAEFVCGACDQPFSVDSAVSDELSGSDLLADLAAGRTAPVANTLSAEWQSIGRNPAAFQRSLGAALAKQPQPEYDPFAPTGPMNMGGLGGLGGFSGG